MILCYAVCSVAVAVVCVCCFVFTFICTCKWKHVKYTIHLVPNFLHTHSHSHLPSSLNFIPLSLPHTYIHTYVSLFSFSFVIIVFDHLFLIHLSIGVCTLSPTLSPHIPHSHLSSLYISHTYSLIHFFSSH
jgi:hypothetical protein